MRRYVSQGDGRPGLRADPGDGRWGCADLAAPTHATPWTNCHRPPRWGDFPLGRGDSSYKHSVRPPDIFTGDSPVGKRQPPIQKKLGSFSHPSPGLFALAQP